MALYKNTLKRRAIFYSRLLEQDQKVARFEMKHTYSIVFTHGGDPYLLTMFLLTTVLPKLKVQSVFCK